jgi:hypothetical protein
MIPAVTLDATVVHPGLLMPLALTLQMAAVLATGSVLVFLFQFPLANPVRSRPRLPAPTVTVSESRHPPCRLGDWQPPRGRAFWT